MSDSTVPPYVDTRKVFLQEEKLLGSIELERLPRFAELLVKPNARIEVALEFSLSRSKQRLIAGQLEASVWVSCQRCLEPVQALLTDEFSLALVQTDEQAAKLEPAFDPWFIDDHKLEVARLVEEQLLLCLPLVNMHEDADCVTNLGYVEPEKPSGLSGNEVETNPFAVLKTLKE